MPTSTLTPLIINAAIEGFEAQRQRIDSQIAELRAMLPGRPDRPAASPEAEPKRRKKFSAETIKRMGEAQRRRRAKVSGEAESSTQTTRPAKAKRKLSAAGKAAIVAALKKRWATKKAASVKPKPATAKTVAPNKRKAKKTVTSAATETNAPKTTATKKRAPVKKAAMKTAAMKETAPTPAQETEAAGQPVE